MQSEEARVVSEMNASTVRETIKQIVDLMKNSLPENHPARPLSKVLEKRVLAAL